MRLSAVSVADRVCKFVKMDKCVIHAKVNGTPIRSSIHRWRREVTTSHIIGVNMFFDVIQRCFRCGAQALRDGRMDVHFGATLWEIAIENRDNLGLKNFVMSKSDGKSA